MCAVIRWHVSRNSQFLNFQELVTQNEQLKAVIEQMSQSMQHALEQEKENQIPEKGDKVKI